MTDEDKIIAWLNWIVDHCPNMVGIAGSGFGFIFRSELLMNSADGYYQQHPEKCWMFQIGGVNYHDTFSARHVENIVVGLNSITIQLKGGEK